MYKLWEKGYQSNECWTKKPAQQNNCSFSTVVEAWLCKSSITGGKVNGLVGPKHIVQVKCLNIIIPAMIDTGSQLTIMPLNVLVKAKENGVDMDNMCQQLPQEDLNVFDASGNKMDQPDRPANAGLSGFFSARFARISLMWHLSHTTPTIPH
ncbi:hypothetical protein Y032_0021g329 [Ancylostoma ceylanicum]|uniref:Uncharacterized protein n=1 Tax=Ancylostoma ceylanicum TaxID=53326 RepID=A0A016UZP6_9BILA|nr:hypothetical protein Y032_0021g329 [Ancylostoma ceylanicum]